MNNSEKILAMDIKEMIEREELYIIENDHNCTHDIENMKIETEYINQIKYMESNKINILKMDIDEMIERECNI